MSTPIVFISGWAPANPVPLTRYLPPLPGGIATAWLRENLAPGSLVLDPFGTAPQLAIEIARAGYRLLVAANNPVTRFLLEMAASPPTEAELQAALALLSSARKGEERLEPHIRSLYLTFCYQCGQELMAEAFLWERDAATPYARIYHCPYCGDAGERPTTRADTALAAQFTISDLHRARALERIAPRDDPDRAHAEEALSAYLPRAVYALFTIINKLEGLPVSSSYRRHLAALLISALDKANTLWPHPTARARPRQLVVPTRFRENNVWLALEEAIPQFSRSGQTVSLTTWPEQPPTGGGVSVFEGRLKELITSLSQVEFGAVLTALPRPNQAFWSLSALWAGWLWGREAAAPFKSVLRRRRYDWGWHTTALHAAMSNLAPLLPSNTPILGLIGEAEPGFLTAALIGAEGAGLDLQGLALRAETGQAQILWKSSIERSGNNELQERQAEGLDELIIQAAQTYLRERGEPASFLQILSAGMGALVNKHAIPTLPGTSPAEMYVQALEAAETAFTYRRGFLRFGGSEKSLEVGHWWLRDSVKINLPLADQVEMATVRYLQKHPGCTLSEMDTALCANFSGLLTPDLGLIKACLESYGEQESGSDDLHGNNRWRLRPQDEPSARRADLDNMHILLVELAGRLGFQTIGRSPVLWLDNGEVIYKFHLLASAMISETVFSHQNLPSVSIIVLPGGRAGLVAYKLRNDPRLRQEVGTGWRFLRFRQLRWLAESANLNRDRLTEQLALNPLTEDAPQMRLL